MFKLFSNDPRAGDVALATVLNSPDPIVWFDEAGHMREANQAALEQLGYTHEELRKITVFDINPRFSKADWQARWDSIIKAGTLRFETIGVHKDGHVIPVEIVATHLEHTNDDFVCFFIHNLVERRKAQNEIADRLKFEALLSDLSKDFISLSSDEIDQHIDDWLEQFLDLFDIDRISIFEVTSGGTHFEVTHSVSQKEFPPIPRKIPEGAFPWSSKQILNGKPIIYESLDQLPPEAKIDKALFEQHGPMANLTVPLLSAEKVQGALSLTVIHNEHPWLEDMVKRVGLIGEIFSNAINRRQNEKEILDSKFQFQSIFESSPFGIYLASPQGKAIAVNPALADMLEYSIAELLELDLSTFTHSDDLEEDRKFLQLLRSNKLTEFKREKRYITKSGETKWGQTTAKKIQDHQGHHFYNMAVVEDITERKRAEEALRESEQNYRNLVTNSLQGTIIYQSDRIIFANPAAENICGFSQKEITSWTGKDLADHMHPDDRRAQRDRINQLLNGEAVVPLHEARFIHKNGDLIWLNLFSSSIDYRGEPAFITGFIDITEKKNAEIALQESEKNFRDAVNALRDATHVIDRDMNIVIFNQRFKEWCHELGLDSDAIGKNLFDVFPFLGEKIRKEYKQVFKTGKVITSEDRVDYGDQIIYTETRKIPIFEGKKVVRVMTSVRDVTEQKLAEKALRESEENYRLIVENQREVIVKFDTEGNIQFVTPSFCELFGGTLSDWMGKPFIQIVHEEDSDRMMKAFESLLVPPFKASVDTRVKTVLGLRWISWVDQSILEDNNVKEIVAIGRDVTAKHNAEDALRQSETRFRSLVENISDIIWVIDEETKIKFETPSAEKILGYKQGELIGIKGIDYVHPDDIEAVVEAFEEVLRKENRFEPTMFRIRHADGHYVYLEAVAVNMTDDDSIDGIILTAHDITVRMKYEKELRDSRTRFKAIADYTYDWENWVDPDGKLKWINPAVERITGFTVDECMAMKDFPKPILHEDFNRDFYIVYADAVRGKAGEGYDFKIRKKDGTERWASVAWQPIYDEDENWLGHRSSIRDVTRLKNAEDEQQRRMEEVWMLNHLAQKVTASLSKEDVIEATIESIDLPIKMDFALIFLCEGENLYLQKLGPKDAQVKHEATPIHRVGQCLCGQAAQNGEAIFSQNIHTDPRCTWKECKQAGIQSFAALPLKSGDEVIGVLGIASVEENDFSGHKGFLLALAGEVAIGLQNALLYEKIGEHAADLEKSLSERDEALAEIRKLQDQLEKENIYLRKEAGVGETFENIISRSESFNTILRKVGQVAATEATVLLIGETGTGKGLIANAIHSMSSRKEHPMVKINCAALPANLIESELFGHEKGSFTGAIQKKIGRFELADESTIFLDEIGDLPLELQAKLLRVLQEGEFERVGSSETLHTNARVVAATNRNLEKAIMEGKFREDLYYRLSVFPIEIPPLRERTDDIPILTEHFVKKYSSSVGKSISQIPRKVMDRLSKYSWPGNVRELENVIERAVILTEGEVIHLEGLELKESKTETAPVNNLREIERDHILKVLGDSNWIIEGPRGAARKLGLAPSTLRDRMRRLDIRKPE